MKFKTPLFFVFCAIFLVGLFFLFKPQEKQTPVPQSTKSEKTPTPVDTKKTFELIFKNKKLTSGDPDIKVQEGDEVTIKVVSDEAEELHVHGYNVFVDLEKDKPATLSFTANISGRFPYELEHSGTEIGTIEVQPKQ
jgi:FtsP/CotA-like multicopper oxidase with cupredoxin domain